MVAEICHPGCVSLKNHCNHAVAAMLYLSVSSDRRNIEESRGNFFLYRNCKLLGTTIGRKLTARQRDGFIERYTVDAKSKPRQECLEELSRLKEVCLF